MEFKNVLDRLMFEKKISGIQLSVIAGVSPQSITNYLKGRAKPTYETISKIANYFNVSTDYLLGESEPSPLIAREPEVPYNKTPPMPQNVSIQDFITYIERVAKEKAKLELQLEQCQGEVASLKNGGTRVSRTELA